MKTAHASRFLESTALTRHDGARLHPVRMKNRDNGRLQFRGSRGGSGGNTKSQTIYFDDEQDVIRFLRAGYSVRCASRMPGSDCNLYSINSRAIVRVEGLVP